MVLVAHDRALLRSCCDEFLLVEEGHVEVFDGDLEDYAVRVSRRRASSPGAFTAGIPSRRDERRERADLRVREAPLRKEIQRIEKRLKQLETEHGEVEDALALPGLYDGTRVGTIAALGSRRAAIGAEIEALEDAWLHAQEALTQRA